jgi:hypothetical protein
MSAMNYCIPFYLFIIFILIFYLILNLTKLFIFYIHIICNNMGYKQKINETEITG